MYEITHSQLKYLELNINFVYSNVNRAGRQLFMPWFCQ